MSYTIKVSGAEFTALRAAMRTNEPQATSVLLLTAITIGTAIEAGGGIAIVASSAIFWPCAAFAINLIDPIPDWAKDGGP